MSLYREIQLLPLLKKDLILLLYYYHLHRHPYYVKKAERENIKTWNTNIQLHKT